MSSSEDEVKTRHPKSQLDEQRLKIEKLMANPDKEVYIPEAKDPKKPRAFFTHEFVRNVMGASAGAGSGEFDIYRGCRRRELIRQEFLEEEDKKKKAAEEFEKKYLENKLESEAKTAKKREKRQKAKNRLKNKKSVKKVENSNESDDVGKMDEEIEEIDLTVKIEDSQKPEDISEVKEDKKPAPIDES